MTREAARDRGAELCRRLAADVAKVAPPGLGAWPKTWGIVAKVDAGYLIALTAWESDPSEAARLRVRDAYNRVLAAWKCAAAEYLATPERAR